MTNEWCKKFKMKWIKCVGWRENPLLKKNKILRRVGRQKRNKTINEWMMQQTKNEII